MGVRSLHTLRASIDTMGEEKTMDFITVLILEHIKEIGVGRVFVVCGWDVQGCLQLDQLYSSSIDGLPENVRTKVSPRCIGES